MTFLFANEPFKVLGIPSALEATQETVRRAYRDRALQLHPDKRPDDPTSPQQFLHLHRAYEAALKFVSNKSEVSTLVSHRMQSYEESWKDEAAAQRAELSAAWQRRKGSSRCGTPVPTASTFFRKTIAASSQRKSPVVKKTVQSAAAAATVITPAATTMNAAGDGAPPTVKTAMPPTHSSGGCSIEPRVTIPKRTAPLNYTLPPHLHSPLKYRSGNHASTATSNPGVATVSSSLSSSSIPSRTNPSNPAGVLCSETTVRRAAPQHPVRAAAASSTNHLPAAEVGSSRGKDCRTPMPSQYYRRHSLAESTSASGGNPGSAAGLHDRNSAAPFSSSQRSNHQIQYSLSAWGL